jgi:HTH-type transcriptional regulator/antitoxin HigA
MDENKIPDIDDLLGSLNKPPTLKELFDLKLSELKMPPTTAQNILGIGYKPLRRLLSGTEKTIDLTNLFKLADFLQRPHEEIVSLYVESLQRNHEPSLETPDPDKVKFIKDNFDLAVLRDAGFIESISDFAQIERRILSRFGLRSIREYVKPPIDVAFSSTGFKPAYINTRATWVFQAVACLRELGNPYTYERDELVKFFPDIRWHSTNAATGLLNVVRNLYKLGITVIFLPHLRNLQVRGATIVVNNKPCIVLTNYRDLYPSLWFTLVHELYHVLFDMEDILESKYHLTDDSNDQASVGQREALADDFAREYLCPKEKLEWIRPHLRDAGLVRDFAKINHVHPSIIYAIHAYARKDDRMGWPRTRRYSPPLSPAIADIRFAWTDPQSLEESIKQLRTTTYN